MNDDCTNLPVRGAEGPNSQPVSGHSVSLHLGTHLISVEVLQPLNPKLSNCLSIVADYDRLVAWDCYFLVLGRELVLVSRD
jgi:hypothetical protein